MGWFGSLCSGIGRVVSGVARSVGRAVSSAASWAVDKASQAIGWLADKATTFVGKAREVWNKVKPYVQSVSKALERAADFVPWPWLKTAMKVVSKGLDALIQLENSPIVKAITKAVEWAAEYAQKLRKSRLEQKEMEEAEQRRRELAEAYAHMQTEEQKQSLRFAMIINEYAIIRTKLTAIIDNNNIVDFDHFLRLRATQKLLVAAEKTLERAQNLTDISSDDLFLIEMGNNLIAEDPTLTDEQALRLDNIIRKRFSNKSLLPFVFEELVRAWTCKLDNMNAEWTQVNSILSKHKVVLNKLNTKQKLEPLNQEELSQQIHLKNECAEYAHRANVLESSIRAMQNYVYAAEGFLQVLEKTEDDFIAEGREYILDDTPEVGQLIVECAQEERPWDALTPKEQSLLRDYANIFVKDSKQRTASLEAEENQHLREIEVS